MSLGPLPGGNDSLLNITTTTVVKASPGVVHTVTVVANPSAAGGVYDATTTAGAVIANQIENIPKSGNSQPITLSWPCKNGIVVNPGTGGVVSVSFS